MCNLGAIWSPSLAILGKTMGFSKISTAPRREHHIRRPMCHFEAILGPIWGHMGPFCSQLEAIVGDARVILVLSCILGASWSHLGGILRPSWGLPGLCRRFFEAILEPLGGHLGAILQRSLAFLGEKCYSPKLAPRLGGNTIFESLGGRPGPILGPFRDS